VTKQETDYCRARKPRCLELIQRVSIPLPMVFASTKIYYLAKGSVSFSSGFSGVGSQGLLLMGRIGVKARGLPSFYLKRPKNFIKHLRYVFFHRYLLGGTRGLYSACC